MGIGLITYQRLWKADPKAVLRLAISLKYKGCQCLEPKCLGRMIDFVARKTQ